MREQVERRARAAKRAVVARARLRRAGVGVAFDNGPLANVGWNALGDEACATPGGRCGSLLLRVAPPDANVARTLREALVPQEDVLAAAGRREMRARAAGEAGAMLSERPTRPGPVCAVLAADAATRISWCGTVVGGDGWEVVACARDL